MAKDAMPIERGNIYIAPPNEHLIIIRDQIVVGHGPEENSWRPSIDVLFRSAAAAYNSHVVGIILTGYLNDGTSGMLAIKRSGGVTMVQDPNEAEFPDMPLHVLNNMEVDYSVSLDQFGACLQEITKSDPPEVQVPSDIAAEADIAQRMSIGMSNVEKLGNHSVFTCPECGGVLWKVNDDIARYRCYTGHTFDESELLAQQGEKVEGSIWVAVRMMEERKNLYTKISKEHHNKGHTRVARTYDENIDTLTKHIGTLKEALVSLQRARSANDS